MVGVRLLLGEDDFLAAGVGAVGIGPGHEARDHGVALAVGVVDVEAASSDVIDGKGEPQEAAFAARSHPGRDVEEGFCQQLAINDDLDDAGLLDDEQAVVVGVGDDDRLPEAGDDRLEPLCSSAAGK